MSDALDIVAVVGEGIIFDERWMRQRAAECRSSANVVKSLRKPADGTIGEIRAAAEGWGFLESLDEMMDRWNDLNDLLRDELGDAADKIDECAGNHGRSESTVSKIIDKLNPFD